MLRKWAFLKSRVNRNQVAGIQHLFHSQIQQCQNMKRRVWAIALGLGLFIAGCTVSPDLTTALPPSPSPSPLEIAPTPTESTVNTFALASPEQIPRIDPTRLARQLQAVVGERYLEPDRDRIRQFLIKTLKAEGWIVETQAFSGGMNVLAGRPQDSAKKGDRILVAAHYDTVSGSPGADDNASSIAAILELAHLLANRSTKHPLEIAFFDGEEQGLKGSLAFVAKDPHLQQLAAVINLEMVGYRCQSMGCQQYPEGLPSVPQSKVGDFIAVVGDREHDFLLQAFQSSEQSGLPPVFTLPIPLRGLLTPDLLRSDHAPFWVSNIGAVMVTDSANFRNPHYHQPTDTLNTLDMDFLAGVTQLVVNATAALLESDF